jgi:hypothetical protein
MVTIDENRVSDVKIHVLVKIKVLAVALIPEGLQLGHNGISG